MRTARLQERVAGGATRLMVCSSAAHLVGIWLRQRLCVRAQVAEREPVHRMPPARLQSCKEARERLVLHIEMHPGILNASI